MKSSFLAFPQKLTNIPLISSKNIIDKSITDEINSMVLQTIKNTNDPCRIFVRPSGTEPVLRVLVEAENNQLVNNLSKIMKVKIEHIINLNGM